MAIEIKASGNTDRGKVRSLNEDAYAMCPDRHLFIIADGLGGHAAGDVASQRAVEVIKGRIASSYSSSKEIKEDLVRAIKEANSVIFLEARENKDKRGMGTTVVVAKIHNDRAIIAHVGDSRAYHIHGNSIIQLTIDHTVVEEYVRMGLVNRGEIPFHPYRHVLSRAVGTGGSVDVDITDVQLTPGDVLLLCTDGLTNMLSNDEILSAVKTLSPFPDRITDMLISLANEKGGIDNITVITIYVVSVAHQY